MNHECLLEDNLVEIGGRTEERHVEVHGRMDYAKRRARDFVEKHYGKLIWLSIFAFLGIAIAISAYFTYW